MDIYDNNVSPNHQTTQPNVPKGQQNMYQIVLANFEASVENNMKIPNCKL